MPSFTVDTSRPFGNAMLEIVKPLLDRDLAQETKITQCDAARAAAVAIIDEANRALDKAKALK